MALLDSLAATTCRCFEDMPTFSRVRIVSSLTAVAAARSLSRNTPFVYETTTTMELIINHAVRQVQQGSQRSRFVLLDVNAEAKSMNPVTPGILKDSARPKGAQAKRKAVVHQSWADVVKSRPREVPNIPLQPITKRRAHTLSLI
jgi:hypothetical protein